MLTLKSVSNECIKKWMKNKQLNERFRNFDRQTQ